MTINLRTYLTEQNFSWEDYNFVAQFVNKFLAFYGTQRFITILQQIASGPYLEADEYMPGPRKIHLSDQF
jgi:hypothetical protein